MIFLHLSVSSSVPTHSDVEFAYSVAEKDSTVDCAVVLVCRIMSVPWTETLRYQLLTIILFLFLFF